MTANTTEQERAAYERELIDNHHYVPSDFSFKDGFYGGDDDYIQFGWDLWQAARRAPVAQVLLKPDAYLVYAKGSTRYWILTLNPDDVPEIYKGGDVLPLFRHAAPQPQEAAPVQLPDPVAYIDPTRQKSIAGDAWMVDKSWDALYTEHQLSAILAQHGIKTK